MTITYLNELRWRSYYSIGSWILAWLVLYNYQSVILSITLAPFQCDPALLQFIYLQASALFIIIIFLTSFWSILVVLPFLFYQVKLFLWPSLYSYEREMAFTSSLLVLICTFVGLYILIWKVGPMLLHFFMFYERQFQASGFSIQMQLNLNSFCLSLWYCCIAFFFVEVIIVIIIIQSWKTPKKKILLLKTYRRFVYLIMLVLGAIFSPPDVFTQLLSFSLLVALWESVVFFLCLRRKYNMFVINLF